MDKNVLKDVQAPLNQKETAYVAVSPKTGSEQCANCRFFLATNWDSISGSQIGPACVLVSGYPEPILATGWCNEWEKREPFEPEPMEVEIVEDEPDAPAEEAAVEVEVTEQKALKVYAAPKTLPVVQKIMRNVKGELQPGTTLVRKGDSRYMLIISSNGFKDRHDEHVATMALKEYVEGFEAGTVRKNKHMFWHAIEVGDIVAAGMVNDFLVEVAKEKGENGKKFYDYVEAHPEIEWGASQGFWVRAKDIREEGKTKTYKRIDKDETSTLPRDAAANLFTLSAIGDGMAKKFETLVDEIFGKGSAEALTKGTGELKKKLVAEGVAHKHKDAETVADAAEAVAEAETEMPETQDAKDRLIMRLVDGMEALLTEVKATMEATAVAEEKAEDVEEEMKSLRKEVTDSLNEIRQKLSLAPRIASQSADTKIADPEEEKKAKERIAPKKTTYFGGLELEAEK